MVAGHCGAHGQHAPRRAVQEQDEGAGRVPTRHRLRLGKTARGRVFSGRDATENLAKVKLNIKHNDKQRRSHIAQASLIYFEYLAVVQ